MQVLKLLLEAAGEGFINLTDRHGRSALLWACETGQKEAVKLLLDKGAERERHQDTRPSRTEQNVSALAMASKAGHVDLVGAR